MILESGLDGDISITYNPQALVNYTE